MAKTLAEKIAKLTKPVSEFDIEDDERNLFDHREEESDSEQESEDETLQKQHYVDVGKSKLRDNTPAVGGKYTGKASSRKELFDETSQFSSGDDKDLSGSDVNDDSDNADESGEVFENEDQDDNSDSGVSLDAIDSDDISEQSESENESEPEEENPTESHNRSKLKELLMNEKKHVINRLSTSAKTDALKGYAVMNQGKLYDQILDTRIKLQKGLSSSNALPLDRETYEKLKDKKTDKRVSKLEDSLFSLLDTIIDLRNKFYKKDNISSKEIKPKKRTFEGYLKNTSELDLALEQFRGQVLTKWSHKIQSASGSTALNASKFKVINQSSETQVQSNLADMERLIKRTRLNRRNVTPLGYTSDNKKIDGDDDQVAEKKTKVNPSQENENIFDDEDFYRVLLNDLVDKKVNEANPTNGLTIALSKTKFKKNVDTRASKGRKLRYHIQEPIQNFEAPKSTNWKWSDDQIDDFFATLLGQKINMAENDEDEKVEKTEEDFAIANDDIRIFG